MCRIINYRSTESIIYNLKEFQYVYFNSLYLVDQNMVTCRKILAIAHKSCEWTGSCDDIIIDDLLVSTIDLPFSYLHFMCLFLVIQI